MFGLQKIFRIIGVGCDAQVFPFLEFPKLGRLRVFDDGHRFAVGCSHPVGIQVNGGFARGAGDTPCAAQDLATGSAAG